MTKLYKNYMTPPEYLFDLEESYGEVTLIARNMKASETYWIATITKTGMLRVNTGISVGAASKMGICVDSDGGIMLED